MGTRKSIGLIYNYNENWIGGTYYIENIIKALYKLEDVYKPNLVIFASDDSYKKLVDRVQYPFMRHQKPNNYNVFERVINFFFRFLFKKNLFKKRLKNDEIDFVFPNPDNVYFSDLLSIKKIYWIPDFQELSLPDFFSTETIESRNKRNLKIINSNSNLVLSSNSVKNDLESFFKNYKCKTKILPFAVTKDSTEFRDERIQDIKEKYKITGSYFIVPNQLWKHKNHQILLETAFLLQKEGINTKIYCTGKEKDNRFPDYPKELKRKAIELEVSDTVQFLGFIPKLDLDVLLGGSLAVIQPSLFEGWNTGIEESKHDNKFIIASDIPVHKEQLDKYPNKLYFNNNSPLELYKSIIFLLDNDVEVKHYDYSLDITNFAKKFIDIK